jgi:nitrous oxidase accessory protein
MNSSKLIMALLFYLSLTGLTQSTLLTVGKEGANYTIIQDAIEAANPGDVIEVRGGTYLEHVIVDKVLVLRGIGNPVIDSNGNGSAVVPTRNGIVLEGFALINANRAGIEINHNDNITIRNNIIRNNLDGISIDKSFNSSIIGNTISNNTNIGLDL